MCNSKSILPGQSYFTFDCYGMTASKQFIYAYKIIIAINTAQTKSEHVVDTILGTLLERLSSALAFSHFAFIHVLILTITLYNKMNHVTGRSRKS